MAEELTLAVPLVKPQEVTTGYKVARLDLQVEMRRFVLNVRGTNGEFLEAIREGASAVTLLRQLNKADGSIKSLERRALEWLATQPEGAALQGVITGVPD